MRQCPFCSRKIPSERFACPTHWYRLTRAEQSEIYACYGEWRAGKIDGEELRRRQQVVIDQVKARSK